MKKYQVFRIYYDVISECYSMEACPLKNSESNIAIFDNRDDAIIYIYGEYRDYGFNAPITIVELFIV